MTKVDYNSCKKAADYILNKVKKRPKVGMILGTALGELADEIQDAVEVDYKEIPNFLESTVESHAGEFIVGRLGNCEVACMSGRFHYYEGYDFEELVIPMRVMKLMGVDIVILTNAAGAVNKTFKPGDIMIINDHIKLMGASPLRGANEKKFGERFFDMTKTYDRDLIEIAKQASCELGLSLREGVYFFMPGPQFETPAEVNAIRMLGGDAVGMSTVTEAITAKHLGMRVLGLSMMANMAAGVTGKPLNQQEVDEAGRQTSAIFRQLISKIVEKV